ncbi:GNAT family N-acetyltransferase, partial [Streptomyces sp. NPDC059575]
MTPETTQTMRARHGRPVHHWRRDLVELAALFTAVAVADAVANLIGHGPDGPALLVASGGGGGGAPAGDHPGGGAGAGARPRAPPPSRARGRGRA